MAIGIEVITKYRSNAEIFIETGSYEGKTIEKALEVKFKKIYSIELASYYYEYCKQKFETNIEVEMILGDSVDKLSELLSNINEPCLFWLDSHYSFGKTAMGSEYCPLYRELEVIGKHHIKNHTILVDDVRLMGTEWKDVSVTVIQNKLLEINSNYILSFERGVIDNDILVARL